MKHETLRLLLLLILAVVILCVNLGGYDLWPPDEPRYAQVAREMMQTGNFFLPQVNGEPYLEKPPLLFWLIAGCSYPGGGCKRVVGPHTVCAFRHSGIAVFLPAGTSIVRSENCPVDGGYSIDHAAVLVECPLRAD